MENIVTSKKHAGYKPEQILDLTLTERSGFTLTDYVKQYLNMVVGK